MTARLLWEEQTRAMPLNTPSEAAFAVASLRLLPPGLVGLMVVAMFSATLSTLDVGLNRNAAIAMRDIYPAICRLFGRPLGSQQWQLALSRIMTGFFGALIVMVAAYYATRSDRGMFAIMLDLGAMVGLPLAVPMLLGVFVRRVPWWAALLSIGVGLAASVVAAADERTWTFQQKGFTILGAGCGAFLLTRPFWSTATSEYRQRVEQFFTTMHTPVDFEEEVGEGNDDRQLRIIGGFVLAMGCFIACLLIVPADTRGRLSTLFVAGTVILTGLLMLYAARRAQRRAERPKPAAVTGAEAAFPALTRSQP